MGLLNDDFDDRLKEIDAYLDLLDSLERQTQLGPPTIAGKKITTQQQRILYSSVYLQLYNLVEATANWCIKAVTEATSDNSRWKPQDLETNVRREWVRTTARTHTNFNPDNRLSEAVKFCDTILDSLPIAEWKVEKGGGGNWDDRAIEDVAKRIGCELKIKKVVETAAKRHIRNDLNSLGLVKDLRNNLAHGDISFEQCGEGVTVGDLRDIKDCTTDYLKEVMESFGKYIDNYHFLSPGSRPAGGTSK